MTLDQCAAMVSLFGFLLLIYLINGRSVRPRYRVGAAYLLGFTCGVCASIAGLVINTIGVLDGSLNGFATRLVWALAGLDGISLFVFAVLLATSFYDEDLEPGVNPDMIGRAVPTPNGLRLRRILERRARWDVRVDAPRPHRER